MTNAPRVLVCDDTVAAGAQLRDALQRAGYDPILVIDGYEAVERIDVEDPAAIVIEVMTHTGLNGFGVLSHIEENRPELVARTLIVTNMTELSVLRLAPAFGSRIYRKPVDPEVVIAAIHRIGERDIDEGFDVVIVADDDSNTRQLLSEYLAARSFRPVETRDGRQTLEVIARRKPRAILLDLMMPGIDGFSVLEHLGRTAPDLLDRIVVVTGIAPQMIAEQLPEAGIRGVIQKPVDFSELDALLGRPELPAK